MCSGLTDCRLPLYQSGIVAKDSRMQCWPSAEIGRSDRQPKQLIDKLQLGEWIAFAHASGPPVIAENLIRAENTAVTPIDESIKFQHESRFHRTVHTLCLHISNHTALQAEIAALRHQIAV